MAQRAKIFATKAVDLSLIPWIHVSKRQEIPTDCPLTIHVPPQNNNNKALKTDRLYNPSHFWVDIPKK